MNNRQFFEIAQTLNTLAMIFQNRSDVPFKFLYGIRRNINYFNPHAMVLYNKLQFVSKFPEKFDAHEKARFELCLKYGAKDDKGNLKIEGQKYVIQPDKIQEFNAEMEQLVNQYPDLKQEREEYEKKSNELMAEGAPEVEIYKINIANFPETGISGAQFEILQPLIDETEEHKKLIRLVN